ncbi:hypothetical protein C8R47DRAFT_1076407 [Mycena vitilis]|nr:hypothetical protein C8R47DRAFT_1076407 [Mycena vitilis]
MVASKVGRASFEACCEDEGDERERLCVRQSPGRGGDGTRQRTSLRVWATKRADGTPKKQPKRERREMGTGGGWEKTRKAREIYEWKVFFRGASLCASRKMRDQIRANLISAGFAAQVDGSPLRLVFLAYHLGRLVPRRPLAHSKVGRASFEACCEDEGDERERLLGRSGRLGFAGQREGAAKPGSGGGRNAATDEPARLGHQKGRWDAQKATQRERSSQGQRPARGRPKGPAEPTHKSEGTGKERRRNKEGQLIYYSTTRMRRRRNDRKLGKVKTIDVCGVTMRAGEVCNARVPSPGDCKREDLRQTAPIYQKTKRGPPPEFHDDFGCDTGREERQRTANAETVAENQVKLGGTECRGAVGKKDVLGEGTPAGRNAVCKERGVGRGGVIYVLMVVEGPDRAEVCVRPDDSGENELATFNRCGFRPDEVDGTDSTPVDDRPSDARRAARIAKTGKLGAASTDQNEVGRRHLHLKIEGKSSRLHSLVNNQRMGRRPKEDATVCRDVRAVFIGRDRILRPRPPSSLVWQGERSGLADVREGGGRIRSARGRGYSLNADRERGGPRGGRDASSDRVGSQRSASENKGARTVGAKGNGQRSMMQIGPEDGASGAKGRGTRRGL